MLEKAWQQQVVDLATYYRWGHFHVLNMAGTDAGWPDLVLIRPPEVLFVELKTDRGRLTDRQQHWLELLAACGLETHVWRPRDFDAVHDRLRPST